MIEVQHRAGGDNNRARERECHRSRDKGIGRMVLVIRVATRARLPNNDVRRKERAEQGNYVGRILGSGVHPR